MKLFDLSNQVALVTGGSRGLGKGIAKGLASAGANIAIVNPSIDPTTVAEIEQLGVKCKGYSFDLRNVDDYELLIEDVVNDFGGLDILCNNAGVQKRHPAVDFPKTDWDFVMDINCDAVFFMCQKVGKLFIKQGHGKIINIASLLSYQGGLTVPAYAASKSAVMGFTKSLANEWARFGVNVNGIAPGYMNTDMNTAIKNDDTRNRQILERIPANRWGTPDDLVGTAIYLASPASDYLHGCTIAVDGGWMGR